MKYFYGFLSNLFFPGALRPGTETQIEMQRAGVGTGIAIGAQQVGQDGGIQRQAGAQTMLQRQVDIEREGKTIVDKNVDARTQMPPRLRLRFDARNGAGERLGHRKIGY